VPVVGPYLVARIEFLGIGRPNNRLPQPRFAGVLIAANPQELVRENAIGATPTLEVHQVTQIFVNARSGCDFFSRLG
jgi:hypothetical protein